MQLLPSKLLRRLQRQLWLRRLRLVLWRNGPADL